MSLTLEQARPIVLSVLSKHGIEVSDKGDVDLMADGLGMAGDRESLWVMADRYDAEEHEHRTSKIDAIEKLLLAYSEEKDRPTLTESGNDWSNSLAFWRLAHNRDLKALLGDLEQLLEMERAINQMFPAPEIPNSRPVTAKNAGARCIYLILSKYRVNTWNACEVIADMLIEAGIANGDRRKVKMALYDKLSRS